MNIKLDQNTPDYLASLFISLMKEGITANQIMVGIVQLATDTQDLDGMTASVDCLRCLLGTLPIDTSAEGVSNFVASLATKGVTTLMLLDALGFACHQCALADFAAIIHLTYQELEADKLISKVLGE
ncbi:hypothetical protein [Cylindrospermum sp. FACHB-282]|uniref:hypothetical protein n=1 Tax=Cylindrospermum sp. FACHB-282 TaxID=2692794 RepID=UPI00168934A0|nr:hypothetical protein [Cylindrospermum sp. FACHB-282]MBD2385811.1 hypothetical protein [Cylindrospermum sp. FACHB-282]